MASISGPLNFGNSYTATVRLSVGAREPSLVGWWKMYCWVAVRELQLICHI